MQTPTKGKGGYNFFSIVSPSCIHDRRLVLPKKFISVFGKELGNIAVLKDPSSKEWDIELRKHKGRVWFQNGWHEFMEYYSICVWYFLMFQYDGNSRFSVVICDMSASEVWYPFEASDVQNCHKENGIPTSSEHKNRKDNSASEIRFNRSESELSKEALCMVDKNPEDDMYCKRNIVPAFTSTWFDNGNAKEALVHKSKKSMSCPPDSRQNRSISDDLCQIKNREGPEKPSLLFQRKKGHFHSVRSTRKYSAVESDTHFTDPETRIGETSTHPEKRQSEHVFRSWKAVPSWEKESGTVSARTITSRNPCSTIKMRPSYVCHKNSKLTLPVGFARTFLEGKFNYVTLQVSDGRMWQVRCYCANHQFRLVSGWKKFVFDNHVEEADTLIFELLDKKRKKLKVTIIHDLNDPKHREDISAQSKRLHPNPDPCVHHIKRSREFADDSEGLQVLGSILKNAGKRVLNSSYCLENNESNVTLTNPISDGLCGMENNEGPVEPSSLVQNSMQKSFANQVKEKSSIAAKSFTSEYPFCSITMRQSYVDRKFCLNIPKSFADKYLKGAFRGILGIPNRRTWHVQLGAVDHRKLFIGWKAFAMDNHLKEHDVCIFELVDKKHFRLNVSIFRKYQLEHPGVPFSSVPSMKSPIKFAGDIEGLSYGGLQTNVKKESIYGSFASARSFKSGYPVCSTIMRRTYVHFPFNMNIPKGFVGKYLKDAFRGITLKLPNRQKWYVRQNPSNPQRLCAGWRAFVRDNHLKEGDVCIFELVDKRHYVLKVSILRQCPLVSCE